MKMLILLLSLCIPSVLFGWTEESITGTVAGTEYTSMVIISTSMKVTGTTDLTGTNIMGNTQFTNKVYLSSYTQSVIFGTNTIVTSQTFCVVSSSANAVTMTATPTIEDGLFGQILILKGNSDTNTLKFQDEGTLTNSNLQLGSTIRTLGLYDILMLLYDGTYWIEIGFINN